ncbi:hypothetical protein PANT_9d00147 [Moesziomyces antarcticus T-34]|uniref:Uncharacterized protein n=1 Tax=Pseudozyma antarctica (strain T-34) TaxID=1151754 RepID=M9MCH4_PSEA3|nr:hypothetical protein PANT_9d00147 [Moesziomyces antarcticus T-34]
MSELNTAPLAGAATEAAGASVAPAEIVTARKISRGTAHAAPVRHFRSNSKSNASQHTAAEEAGAGTLTDSPRVLPSPVPPPVSALPPTPNLASAASPTLNRSTSGTSGTSSFASPTLLSKSIRKTLRHLSASLTPQERIELVHKINADLRPPHTSTVVRPFSRAPRSATPFSQPHPSVAVKMTSSASHGSEDKRISSSSSYVSSSDDAIPIHPSELNKTAAAGNDSLSPSAALESLRVLENSFEKSAPNSPMDGAFTKDSDHSQTTLVTSPKVKPGAEAASPPTHKRNSSYRKSVPTLDELNSGTKRAAGVSSDGSRRGSSIASSERAPSPTSATTETPSWISSLTTLEAIRVLAFQQAVNEPASPYAATASAAEAAASHDEVMALRYSLSFSLSRADKLAESLQRANEDRLKLETELEILRRNVLSMLGSRNMFSSPVASPSLPGYESAGRSLARDDIVEEEADPFEHAQASNAPPAAAQAKMGTRAAAAVSRPPRAGRVAKAVQPAPSAPAAAGAGVSIASLRKKNAALAATASSAAQRYEPPSRTTADDYETEDEEDEFDMYPFGAPVRKKNLPEVSMTDFLNASRMSKTEIDQHDARRELERDDQSSYPASISSHSPLYDSRADANRRGFFKGITKLVDDRSKRLSRRTSLASKPSVGSIGAPLMARSASGYDMNRRGNGFAMQYEEQSIIPSARSTRNNISLDSSLRESIERHSLRDAGILA